MSDLDDIVLCQNKDGTFVPIDDSTVDGITDEIHENKRTIDEDPDYSKKLKDRIEQNKERYMKEDGHINISNMEGVKECARRFKKYRLEARKLKAKIDDYVKEIHVHKLDPADPANEKFFKEKADVHNKAVDAWCKQVMYAGLLGEATGNERLKKAFDQMDGPGMDTIRWMMEEVKFLNAKYEEAKADFNTQIEDLKARKPEGIPKKVLYIATGVTAITAWAIGVVTGHLTGPVRYRTDQKAIDTAVAKAISETEGKYKGHIPKDELNKKIAAAVQDTEDKYKDKLKQANKNIDDRIAAAKNDVENKYKGHVSPEEVDKRINDAVDKKIKEVNDKFAGHVSEDELTDRINDAIADAKKQAIDEIEKKRKLQEQLEAQGLAVTDHKDGSFTVRYDASTFYKPGSSDLSAAAMKNLDQLSTLPNVTYAITGTSDPQPLRRTKGIYGTNYNLSMARVKKVMRYLRSKGVQGKNILFAGVDMPEDPKSKGIKKARSVNVRVYAGDAQQKMIKSYIKHLKSIDNDLNETVNPNYRQMQKQYENQQKAKFKQLQRK